MVREDEQGLVESARLGDRHALEALMEKYQRHLYRFGMKMCGDPEDAKDVLQDTLLAMSEGLKHFRGGSSLTTWLYAIARSFCIKKRRRSQPPQREEPLDSEHREVRALPDSRRVPEEEIAGQEVEQVLERAIRSLDPMYREVLVLRDVEGLPAQDVAQVLGISVEAVKSRLHRARMAVRAKVAPALGIGDEEPNADCPDVVSLLSQYLEGEVDTAVCAEMERHVQQCPRCGSACDSLRKTLAMCRAIPSPTVPAPVQELVREAVRSYLAEG